MPQVFRSDVPGYRQRVHCEYSAVVAELRVIGGSVVGNLGVPFLQGNPEFVTREVGPEAAVRPGSERKVTVRPSIEPDRLGVAKLPRIAIADLDCNENPIILADQGTTDFDIPNRSSHWVRH